MKKILILAMLYGCATHSEIIYKATDLTGYRDLNYWVRYGNNVLVMSPELAAKERELIEQYQTSADWVAQFEYAVFVGLRAKNEKDYRKSMTLLESISKLQDLDEDSILAIQWYLLHIRESRKLFEYGKKQQMLSDELNNKLKALSTIEKKIQKRSEQVVR